MGVFLRDVIGCPPVPSRSATTAVRKLCSWDLWIQKFLGLRQTRADGRPAAACAGVLQPAGIQPRHAEAGAHS